MNGLTSLQNNNDIEDVILDNYVSLYNQAMNRRKFGFRSNGMMKKNEASKVYRNTCQKCKKEFDSLRKNKLYCGNKLTREGCAWIRTSEGSKKGGIITAAKRWNKTNNE